jgi:hypothetical protein
MYPSNTFAHHLTSAPSPQAPPPPPPSSRTMSPRCSTAWINSHVIPSPRSSNDAISEVVLPPSGARRVTIRSEKAPSPNSGVWRTVRPLGKVRTSRGGRVWDFIWRTIVRNVDGGIRAASDDIRSEREGLVDEGQWSTHKFLWRGSSLPRLRPDR